MAAATDGRTGARMPVINSIVFCIGTDIGESNAL
jgi:hypothetical protein